MTGRNLVVGTAVAFAASGAIQASWLSRLPAIVDTLRLQPSDVGLGIACVGLGWAIAMPTTAALSRRFGLGRFIVWPGILACASIAPLGEVATPAVLYASLLAFGLTSGACDAAMNIHGYEVERRRSTPLMPMFHGFWSVGAGLGAIAGAFAEYHQVGVRLHVVVAAITCAVAFLLARPWLLSTPQTPIDAAARQRSASALLKISILLACATVVEGTVPDWVPTLFRSELDAPDPMGPSLYAAFAAAMALSRFLAVPMQRWRGRAWLVRWGAIVAALGALALLSTEGPFAYAGAMLWGLGVGPIFPAAISARGEARDSGSAIALTTLIGYIASLVGPVAIGLVADQLGILLVLLVVPALALVIAKLAPAVDSPGAPRRAR